MKKQWLLVLTFPNQKAWSIWNMTYGNLPNWTDNFSFLGRISMEMELKVRTHFLAHSPWMEVLVAGCFSMGRGENGERGGRWHIVMLEAKRYCSVPGLSIFPRVRAVRRRQELFGSPAAWSGRSQLKGTIASGKVTVPRVMPGDKEQCILPAMCMHLAPVSRWKQMKAGLQDFPEEESGEPDWCARVHWELWAVRGRRYFSGHSSAFPECDVLCQGQRLGWWQDKSVDTKDTGFVCVFSRSILYYRPILILAASLRLEQTRYLQSLEPLSPLSSSAWIPPRPSDSD